MSLNQNNFNTNVILDMTIEEKAFLLYKQLPFSMRKEYLLFDSPSRRAFLLEGYMTRKCRYCKEEKQLKDFYRNRTSYDRICKKCKCVRYRVKYWKNPDKFREKCKLDRKNNKKQHKIYDQRNHNKNKFGGNRFNTLKRDNYHCQKCDIGGEDDLLVHHIDRNKKNNKSFNLLTVCLPCHAKIHNNYRKRTKEGCYAAN